MKETADVKCCVFKVLEYKINLGIIKTGFTVDTQSIRSSFESEHDKTNKMTFEPSEDTDQPGH